MAGSIPLSTLRAKVEYGFAEAKTAQGNIGVKVWVNNGDYLDPQPAADAAPPPERAAAAAARGAKQRRRSAMPLMPKRVKFRKSARGVIRGNAHRGNTVSYGDFGLQALEGGWLSAEAIEAGRITATHSVRGEGRLFIRVFPHKSITAIPAETRMGKGKGEPEYWAAVIKPGMILLRNRRPAGAGGPRRPGPRGLQDAVQVPFRDAAAERGLIVTSPSASEGRYDEQAGRISGDERRAAGPDPQGHDQAPVPSALPVRDRAAGDAERDPARPSRRSPASRRFSASASCAAAAARRPRGRSNQWRTSSRCNRRRNRSSAAGGASKPASSPATR